MERLTVAALIPFKRYVRLRRTGRSRIVRFDDKKVVLRSSILPKPGEPIEVRYSRVGLRKALKRKSFKELRKEALRSLPRDRPYSLYRLLERLERIRGRKNYMLGEIRRLKAEVLKLIGYSGLALRKLLRRLVGAKAREFEAYHGYKPRIVVDVRPAKGIGAILRRIFGYKKFGGFLIRIRIAPNGRSRLEYKRSNRSASLQKLMNLEW